MSKQLQSRPGQVDHGTTTAVHTAIAHQLTNDVTSKLLDPLELLLDPDRRSTVTKPLRQQLAADAEMWAAQITGPDERLADETMMRVIAAAYQDGEEFDPPASWWQTPFGSLVARRFGHPTTAVVSLTVAAAMLGITRQGAHDLVKRGKLQRDPDGGGVLVSSIRDRIDSG